MGPLEVGIQVEIDHITRSIQRNIESLNEYLSELAPCVVFPPPYAHNLCRLINDQLRIRDGLIRRRSRVRQFYQQFE